MKSGLGSTSIDVLVVEFKMGKFIPGLFKDCQSNKTKKRHIK